MNVLIINGSPMKKGSTETIMRDCGVKNSRWLHCAGLWVDDMEGQAERLQGYAQQARELAGEVCGYEQGVIPRTEAIGIRR